MTVVTHHRQPTTRIAATVVGVYAAGLGLLHGLFELTQGAVAPGGVMFPAMGAPCQPDTVAHACFPAMTLIPNLQLSGLLTICVALAIAVCSVWFIGTRRGRTMIVTLAVILLLVGGGFLPPFYTLLAVGVAASEGRMWPRRLPRIVARLWPGLLIAYLGWVVVQLVFGQALNDVLLSIGAVLVPLEIITLLLALSAAIAHDAHAKETLS